MIRAKKDDKQLIAELLIAAFNNNSSVNYIIRQDDKRNERILALIDYSFEMCIRFGEVWLSENRKACALVLFPHQKRTTLAAVWLDIKLVFNAIGIVNIGKAMKRESLIKNKQPNKPMAYLWFIGVNPFYQHQGSGSRLLTGVLEAIEKLDLPVYLETSTLRNLPWYEKHGFAVYDSLDLGYELHFLTNDTIK